MPTDDRQGVYNIGIGEQTLGVSDKTLDYLVENLTKYNLMSTEASIASFGRGNQDFPVLLMNEVIDVDSVNLGDDCTKLI